MPHGGSDQKNGVMQRLTLPAAFARKFPATTTITKPLVRVGLRYTYIHTYVHTYVRTELVAAIVLQPVVQCLGRLPVAVRFYARYPENFDFDRKREIWGKADKGRREIWGFVGKFRWSWAIVRII